MNSVSTGCYVAFHIELVRSIQRFDRKHPDSISEYEKERYQHRKYLLEELERYVVRPAIPELKTELFSLDVDTRFGNLGVSFDKKTGKQFLVGDTNDSANWETIKVELPYRDTNWEKRSREGTTVFFKREF